MMKKLTSIGLVCAMCMALMSVSVAAAAEGEVLIYFYGYIRILLVESGHESVYGVYLAFLTRNRYRQTALIIRVRVEIYAFNRFVDFVARRVAAAFLHARTAKR